MRKNSNYWTKEKCKDEALKYNSFEDFKNNGGYIFQKCCKNGWLEEFFDDCCNRFFFTKEVCLLESLKYKTKTEFRENSKKYYDAIIRNRWYDLFSHMEFTKELCFEESKKYNTKTEFKKGSYQAYKHAYINCWLEDICKHMPQIGNLYKRCIYSFEFPDNNVYVGLTYNIDIREKQHYITSSSQVNKHYVESGFEPKLIKLTDYIDVNLAKIKEGEYIQFYKNNNWCILNSQKAGNIGGNKKIITKEKCKEIASKYLYLKDFRTEKTNIYKHIVRYKWYDCCDFLIKEIPKQKIKWTKEVCGKEALKYQTKTDFEEGNINAYNACVRNKWLNELCSHMVTKSKLGGKVKWTYESCKEIAFLYKTKNELKKNNNKVYQSCIRNKWIDEFYKI